LHRKASCYSFYYHTIFRHAFQWRQKKIPAALGQRELRIKIGKKRDRKEDQVGGGSRLPPLSMSKEYSGDMYRI